MQAYDSTSVQEIITTFKVTHYLQAGAAASPLPSTPTLAT
jgi:hypothetical protein